MSNDLAPDEHERTVRHAVQAAITADPEGGEKDLLRAVMISLRGRTNPAIAIRFIREAKTP